MTDFGAKVLYKPVGKAPYIKVVPDDYKEFQKIVGGVYSGYYVKSFIRDQTGVLSDVMLLCHDEGKLIGLPFNCYIGLEPLVGPILFVAHDNEGNVIDITYEQIRAIKSGLLY